MSKPYPPQATDDRSTATRARPPGPLCPPLVEAARCGRLPPPDSSPPIPPAIRPTPSRPTRRDLCSVKATVAAVLLSTPLFPRHTLSRTVGPRTVAPHLRGDCPGLTAVAGVVGSFASRLLTRRRNHRLPAEHRAAIRHGRLPEEHQAANCSGGRQGRWGEPSPWPHHHASPLSAWLQRHRGLICFEFHWNWV